MNITLKDIPEKVHRNLRLRADSHGRSLNKEVIDILAQAVMPRRKSPIDFLHRIESRRNAMPHIVKEGELQQIIKEGR